MWYIFLNNFFSGWTPIQTAALKGHTDIVKILAPLSHKSPNSKNKTGFSPMYLAKQMGNNEIVSILKSFKWIIFCTMFSRIIDNIYLSTLNNCNLYFI